MPRPEVNRTVTIQHIHQQLEATGERKLLEALARHADHIDATLGREPGKKRGCCGHPEIELALVKL